MSNKTFTIVIIVIILMIMGPILLVAFWEEDTEEASEKVEKTIIEPYTPGGFSYIKGKVEQRICDRRRVSKPICVGSCGK